MARHSDTNFRRPVLLSFKFLSVSLAGSLVMVLVSAWASIPVQIAVLGGCISILAGLFVAYVEQEEQRERQRAELLEKLQMPLALAKQPELFALYEEFAGILSHLARQDDAVFRQFATLKLAALVEQARPLSEGRMIFAGTETWRTLYEQLLRSPGLRTYLSVAWVKTKDYWQDAPGKQSLRVNFDLLKRNLDIERIVILRGELWPEGTALPLEPIRSWLDEQHNRGVRLFLVREREVLGEPDLVEDFGIYDDRATAVQELDEQSRTLRFTLSFDPAAVRLARDRWSRLRLYAVPYPELLENREKGPQPS